MSNKIHITWEQLHKVAPNIAKSADVFVGHINAVMDEYQISDTVNRISMFLANAMHESRNFSRLEENLNYSAERLVQVWPTRFPNIAFAKTYANNPEKLGNFVYANRYGNGNATSGDGYRFRGRGIFMTTFRDNYEESGVKLGKGKDFFVKNPELIATPEYAVKSAGIFWDSRDLKALADTGDVKAVRKAINGGSIGLKEVQELFDQLSGILVAAT